MATADATLTVSDADAAVVPGQLPPSARMTLDRGRIVNTAIEFADEHGLVELSMRRLGALLGVKAMALYHYVPSKEDLLDAVVEELVESMTRDDDVLTSPRNGWQDFLQRLAHGIRRIALDHPKIFPLVASRPPQAPWLRPPLRSLAWVEVFLIGLGDEGFTDAAALKAYRAFSSFLLGHLLVEVSMLEADVGPLDVADHSTTEEPGLCGYPTVARLRKELCQDHAAVEFEEALDELLDRLALVRHQHLQP